MQYAYVTGADRGLGLALVKVLLDHDFTVFAGSYMPEWPQLKELQSRQEERMVIVPLDITDGDSVSNAAKSIEAAADSLDIVINNAAVFQDRSGTIFDEMYFEDMRRIVETNTFGPLRVTKSMLPLLLKGKRKLLVNISSEAGSISQCWRIKEYGYSMSKAALNMQSAILQNHLRDYGIKVLAIHPGWVRSYMLGKLNEEATVEPQESAEGIYKLLETQTDLDGPIYMDYQGNHMPW